MRRLSVMVLSLVLPALLVGSAGAAALDELKPQILEEAEEIKKKVEAGDVPGALESVQLVDAWLRQVQAEGMEAVFLKIPGWDLEVGESQSAGTAFFGGGVTADAIFRKGDIEVHVNIIGNSPMFGMISGMMGMAVAGGKKVEKVASRKTIVDESGGKVEYLIPAEGNTVVTVNAPDKESARTVAEKGIGWETLEKAVQSQ